MSVIILAWHILKKKIEMLFVVAMKKITQYKLPRILALNVSFWVRGRSDKNSET